MLMDQFMKLTASQYLHSILKEPISKVMAATEPCEVCEQKVAKFNFTVRDWGGGGGGGGGGGRNYQSTESAFLFLFLQLNPSFLARSSDLQQNLDRLEGHVSLVLTSIFNSVDNCPE